MTPSLHHSIAPTASPVSLRLVRVRNALVLCGVAVLLLVTTAAAAAKAKKESSPLRIKADKMEYLKEEGCMVAQDNVVITLDDQTLYADKVVAYLDTSKDGKEKFSKIVATGRVRIQTPEQSVTGKKGVWECKKSMIRITGSPVWREKGGREITADAIKYDLLLRKCTFEGDARARIRMSDKNKKQLKGF